MLKKEFKEKYTEVQSLQGENGNYNFDRYMLGLYNGMEMIIALYENREPNYKDANEIKFLSDKQDILQQRIDKAIIFASKNINSVLTRDTIISILQDKEVK